MKGDSTKAALRLGWGASRSLADIVKFSRLAFLVFDWAIRYVGKQHSSGVTGLEFALSTVFNAGRMYERSKVFPEREI